MLSGALKIKTSAAWHILNQLRSAVRTRSFLRTAVQVVEGPSPPEEGNARKGHYDQRMKLAMSFDEAVERLADVTIAEIEAVKESRSAWRQQRKGWR